MQMLFAFGKIAAMQFDAKKKTSAALKTIMNSVRLDVTRYGVIGEFEFECKRFFLQLGIANIIVRLSESNT